MKNYSISLTAEEREMVLNQLSARKEFFREELIGESSSSDHRRFDEITKALTTLNSAWNKILYAYSERN